jgi:hypothetical protein
MPEDIFQFDNKPWIDGSTPVLKNKEMTICPDADPIAVPGAIEGRVNIIATPCRKNCPRLHQVARAKKEDPNQKEYGYIMACERTPQFIKIGEPEEKIKTNLRTIN